MYSARISAIALFACACASAPRGAVSPAPRAEDAWAPLTWEERHDVMTFAVLPNMARLFQRFEGAPYPEMTCATCHGDGYEEARYAMPRGLPALDAAHLPTASDPDPRTARIARFMIDEVTPAMRDLLGPGHPVSCFT